MVVVPLKMAHPGNMATVASAPLDFTTFRREIGIKLPNVRHQRRRDGTDEARCG